MVRAMTSAQRVKGFRVDHSKSREENMNQFGNELCDAKESGEITEGQAAADGESEAKLKTLEQLLQRRP